MKIVIKKGSSLEKALEQASDFLIENYSNYPILKNDMNVYVTLKNSEGQICPDNEKEYVLRESGQATDVFEEDKKNGLNERLNHWNEYVRDYLRHYNYVQKLVVADKVYLESAKDKGRSEKNIEKRMKQQANNLRELENAHSRAILHEQLNWCIENGKHKTYFIKNTRGSSYKYSLSVAFVFDNINGYTGYFDNRGLHDGIINLDSTSVLQKA